MTKKAPKNLFYSVTFVYYAYWLLRQTVRAFPDQLSILIFFNLDLSVISTAFTVVTLCIQLCIHNVIVNILHNRKYCRNIVLHIRYFDVTDCSTR